MLHQEQRNSRIESMEVLEQDDDDMPEGGLVFGVLVTRDTLERATNFSHDEVIALYHLARPYLSQLRTRGRAPKLDDLDALCLLLYWMRNAQDYPTIAGTFNLGITATTTAIFRARQALFMALESKWWTKRPRPKKPTVHPHIALLLDSTSVVIPKPLGTHHEEKRFYDAKNCIHALKKQVAVAAAHPYYALFSAPAAPGSTHDYAIFKANYEPFVRYLAKTPEELQALAEDTDNDKLAILADSGYIGPATNTPGVRLIALKKPSQLTVAERDAQASLARARVPVEAAFGRVKKMFGIFSTPYRWEQIHFDMTFDLALLLMNEQIQRRQLVLDDANFNDKHKEHQRVQRAALKERRRAQQKRWYLAKKARTRAHLNQQATAAHV
jgi:hypothetical protein